MTVGHVQGDALAGHLLGGRYRLDGLVGRGGMANVYRATDEVLDRGVAVKLFGEASDDDAHASRAAMEVRLLAALNHPSLVTLYDARVGVDQDAFLVMELVDGPTLRDRIAGGAIGRVDIATMAGDLAEALHAVHAAGMVHRDVKPSNVLLAPSVSPTREFRAKLADFGIAHLVDSARLTTPGTIMGTAAYLSPEQTRGVAPAPAGDVYSLGLVLLESFTRERAFPGSMAESLVARVQRDPVIPGEIGYAWKSLLTSMTSRTPEDRPTALEVAASARDILSTEGTGPIVSDATAAVPTTTGTGAEAITIASTSVMASTTAAAVESAATQKIALADDSPSGEPSLAANRRTRRAAGRTASSRRRRSRRTVGVIAGAAVVVALGAGLTSWVVADRSVTPTAADGLTLGGLLTSVDTVSSGVSALVSDRQTATTPDAVPAADTDTSGTDSGTDTTSPSETDGTDSDPAAPAPTAPDDTAPVETTPEETTPDETTPDETTPEETAPDDTTPEVTDPEPTVPGNGNGNAGNGNGNPGNGNGPGNNSGKGNG